MRFYLCIFLLSITLVQAQTYEAGVILGGTNALADVGSQKHLSPSNFGFGLLFKWNKSQRYAWRAGLSYTNLSFNDKEAQDPARILRNLIEKKFLFLKIILLRFFPDHSKFSQG